MPEWQRYQIRQQPVGRANGRGGLDWSYPWQVTRPGNHPLMQRDNWEVFAYKYFDTFEHALSWANQEATRDRLHGDLVIRDSGGPADQVLKTVIISPVSCPEVALTSPTMPPKGRWQPPDNRMFAQVRAALTIIALAVCVITI